MYRVVTGPFHPHLETTLLEDIQQLKASDPLAPLAIVVPSELLRRHLQWLLCVKHRCALINVYFLTFHQLALRLYDEHILLHDDHRVGRVELVHDLFFEHLVQAVVTRDTPSLGGLNLADLSVGSWAALWTTIRDLKEAMVDPSIVLHGIKEGLFEEDEREKLQVLFTLYSTVLNTSSALNVASTDDLASSVIPLLPDSEFLRRLHRVCYYGFYDLTQVQLSLFEAIASQSDVRVYFPLSDNPSDQAFIYARRFFEQHLSSGVPFDGRSDSSRRGSISGNGPVQTPKMMLMNTVGPDDELTLVSKEILNLVDTHGYRFDEVGVVARSLEPYQPSLRRILEQHRIPFTSSAMVSITQEPFIHILIQLANLPLNRFHWRSVLDILISPYYRIAQQGMNREDIQSELWHRVVGTLGITRGEEQWNRLDRVSKDGVESGGKGIEDESKSRLDIDPAQVRTLYGLVTQLVGDCRSLPSQGSPGMLTEAFASLVRSRLAFPGMGKINGAPHDSDRGKELDAGIQKVFSILGQFDHVCDSLTWEEWTRLFVRALKACPIPIESGNHQGVRILDAMSARGLSFRAVFLLGMNEKIFPRFIQEDAFLRDRHRRVLAETFGYKIDEKLAGYDEERLLFALMKQGGRERCYLLYQRANQEGRPLAPSPYLTEIQSPHPVEQSVQEMSLPRRFSDRMGHPLFGSKFLTKEERGIRLILQGYDPMSFLDATRREALLFRNGWKAMKKVERHSRRLGSYDGYVGVVDVYWRQVTEKGFSPTSLEMYARCPFQYFSKQVLRAKAMRPAIVEELPPSSIGELCHAVLSKSYRQLIEDGWPTQELSHGDIRRRLESSGQEVFATYAEAHAIGYFLTWQLAQDKILQLLISVVNADQHHYRETGFRPIACEVDAEGRIEGLGSRLEPLTIRGRLDRVDLRDDPHGVRVVDYKFQTGSQMKSKDRDLLLAAVRGFHLQPAVYALMTKFYDHTRKPDSTWQAIEPEGVDFVFLAPRWETTVVRSGFDRAAWKASPGPQLTRTMRTIGEGIQSGRYFILPGEYCQSCEFMSACRRSHSPTWWRSHRSSPAHQLRRLRKQGVSDD